MPRWVTAGPFASMDERWQRLREAACVPRAAVRAALVAALLGAGFAAGWLAHGATAARAPQPVLVIREEGPRQWRFINPLLECEMAGGGVRPPEMHLSKRLINDRLDRARSAGEVTAASVYFRELNDGPWIGVNERAEYIPASLLKLPTLIAALKRAETDPGFLGRRVVFEGQRDDNAMMAFPPAETLEPGRAYTVEELCRRMVQYSDNNATGLLNTLVPMPEQEKAMRGLGVLPELVATRGRLSVKAVSAFLRVLYNASYLSREHSEKALEMLSRSSFRQGIIAGLPEGTPVAGKYGEAAGEGFVQLHEFSIVYHARRPYLLGVMTQGRDFAPMAALIRDVSRIVHGEVDHQSGPRTGAL